MAPWEPGIAASLPEPSTDMSPEDLGELLLCYVACGKPLWKMKQGRGPIFKVENIEPLLFHGARPPGLWIETGRPRRLEQFGPGRTGKKDIWGGVPAQLSKAGLRGCDLSGFKILGASLTSTDLTGAMLDRANFDRADGLLAKFCGASMRQARAWNASFLNADFSSASLVEADFQKADLSSALLVGADLRRANLSGARLAFADLHGADVRGARMTGADLTGVKGFPVARAGCVLDAATYERSGWTFAALKAWLEDGALIEAEDELPADVQARLPKRNLGLTLTFDARLHRLDPAAVEVLISELFGDHAGITVEERSAIDTAGPTFIRVNGREPGQLAELAKAFYDRSWRQALAAAEQAALERLVPRGFGMVIVRLDSMRDGCTGVCLRMTPEGGDRGGAALVPLGPDLSIAIADLDRLIKEENKVRALERLLVHLFDDGGLHGWTQTHFGVDVAAALPGAIGGNGHVAAGAVTVWQQHGLVDTRLFRLLADQREAMADAVWAVARRWGVLPG
jgi:uncharacterized protein YjbI with pentapeptide repeats